MIDERLLKNEEKAVFHLRALYRSYGYLPYRMSKFEAYELYMRNKDFLVSDRVITFNDTNGSLLALKPDVTLSIIKNGEDIPGVKQKVYYNENVYRVSENTHRYKEIMQTGLECIGDLDLYDVFEVVSLAAQSLAQISESFVLEISHLGLLSDALKQAHPDPAFGAQALRFIEEKNAHDLLRLCDSFGVPQEKREALCVFITAYGSRQSVLSALRAVYGDAAVAELSALSALLDGEAYADRIRFDFSVVNDMNYYNGFVFKGFLDGVCEGVLAGGQYDNMMRRMGRSSGAVGFAIYLDLLEQMTRESDGNRVDVLLLYDETIPREALARQVRALIAEGRTVSAQRAVPESLKYGECLDLRKEGAIC